MVTILLLWIYITCFIIIIGAEINAIIHQRHVIKGSTPEEAALKHDDNNENHYNENTKYEYDSTASSKYEKNYDVDPTPNDKHSEQDSFVDKIKDKFDKDK